MNNFNIHNNQLERNEVGCCPPNPFLENLLKEI
jgi:hypothetical protein